MYQTIERVDALNAEKVYDVIAAPEGSTALVIEWVSGQPLRERLERGPLPVSSAITIARSIANVLVIAYHRHGLFLRDLTPSNVLLDDTGAIKVLDFVLENKSGSLTTPLTVATTEYMPPEQIVGAPLDMRSNVWSLGVILYEMVTGHLPFQGDMPLVAFRILNHSPDMSLISDAGLVGMLSKALAKNPSERFASGSLLRVDMADP